MTNKKQTYIVSVSRRQYGEIRVEADNKQEAIEKAKKRILVKWQNKNYGDVEIVGVIEKNFSFLP